ncbi:MULTISPECIES: hypothetical protein [Stenotrophomonas]|mgnify:FL=1|uniref:Entry exclusion lipoprotein TrbK n=1 Tax=Stenotrophomonas maltophilia TaxID=40324 RepID=A0AAD0FLH3_STEMA|nr:hypothetical protein [Stenotrophomonas maltophilia]AUI06774.1 hypothetical protein SmaCSM2_06105 [Stenotrophomonas maltophilia]MBA2130426.1 hypothetical protein [Stenotrophomonas maltophilia]MBH1681798.1 hypothetical protein [Stenotrophomonas maltophilia]MBH1873414.1 hypothetical protein [Stenotrophomonas maltophilia]
MHQRLQVKWSLALALIGAALAACSMDDRLGDTQIRPTDRPECLVGSQRQDLASGVRPLIGGTGCRADPDNPRPLNKPPE